MNLSFTFRRGHALALAFAFALVASACGSSTPAETSSSEESVDDSATTAETTADATNETSDDLDDGESTSVLAGVEAAQWADNVTITIGDGVFRYESDGIPGHELPDQMLVPTGEPGDEDATFVIADNPVAEAAIDVEIPLNPVYSDEVTLTDLGIIGVVISGARLFNDYENQERTLVAVDDNIEIDGVYFLDACNGHTGMYHYHGIPYCVTDDVDIAGQHSTILGFVIDGFPFYGNKNADGSPLTNADLDECGGHVGATPEFPDGIYHYHLTDDAAPYSVDCYHGVVDTSAVGAGGPPAGGDAGGPPADGQGPDLAEAAAALGVSVDELQAALGAPPFDLDAAAAELGVTAAEIEAVLPPPPG